MCLRSQHWEPQGSASNQLRGSPETHDTPKTIVRGTSRSAGRVPGRDQAQPQTLLPQYFIWSLNRQAHLEQEPEPDPGCAARLPSQGENPDHWLWSPGLITRRSCAHILQADEHKVTILRLAPSCFGHVVAIHQPFTAPCWDDGSAGPPQKLRPRESMSLASGPTYVHFCVSPGLCVGQQGRKGRGRLLCLAHPRRLSPSGQPTSRLPPPGQAPERPWAWARGPGSFWLLQHPPGKLLNEGRGCAGWVGGMRRQPTPQTPRQQPCSMSSLRDWGHRPVLPPKGNSPPGRGASFQRPSLRRPRH